MGASPEVIQSGHGFTQVMLGGNITVVLLFLINAVFRGSGDAAIAMRVLWFGNVLNIVLGPCFIFGLGPFPALGVAGAAVATNIGRGSAVVYQIVTLVRGNGRVRLRREHLRLDVSLMRSVVRLSGSGTIQILIGTASYIALVRIISVFGSDALAGYTIGFRGHHLRAAAGFRAQQRRGNDGRTEPGRGPAGSRRACGVGRRALQHALPG